MSYFKNLSRHARIVLAIFVGAVVGAGAVAGPVAATSTGGITVYEAKDPPATFVNLKGGAVNTNIATKAMPAGKYLVHVSLYLQFSPAGTPPVTWLWCGLATSAIARPDFLTYLVTQPNGGTSTLSGTEVFTLAAGQSLHLICDDLAATSTDSVNNFHLDATPINLLG